MRKIQRRPFWVCWGAGPAQDQSGDRGEKYSCQDKPLQQPVPAAGRESNI